MSAPADLDLGDANVERQAELARAQRLERARARRARGASQGGELAQATPGQPQPTEPEPAGGEEPARQQGGTVAGQIVGGVSDAIQETGRTFKDVADWINEKVPGGLGGGIIYEPGKGVRWASEEEIRMAPGFLEKLTDAVLPDIPKNDSIVGSVARGIAQFATGFVGTGKVAALQRLGQLGTAGRIAAPLARGAVADFAAFDPAADRLSDLVQAVPALQNPVTEFLAGDADDSEIEGRVKNALEGIGLGAATDGLFRGLRALRSMRTARAAAGVTDDAAREVIETAGKQRAALEAIGGGDIVDQGRLTSVRPAEIEGLEGQAAEALARGAGAGQPGEIMVNWNRIASDDDVKSVIQEMANTHADTINEARRGVRSWAETKLSAAQKDAFDVLSKRRIGQPLNAEEGVAVRELWARSGAQLRDLAAQVRQNPGDLNKIAFRRQLSIHNTIQEQVIAARTETARALNAWAIPAGDDASFARQLEELRDLVRADTDVEDLARSIGELADAGLDRGVETFIAGTRSAKGAAMIRQLFYFSRLSSPLTHVRNFLGNTAAIPMQMLESKGANLIGKAFGEANIPDGETLARGFGYLQGMQRALRTTQKGREVFGAAVSKYVQRDASAARELLAQNADEFSPVLRAAATGQSGFGVGKVVDAQRGAFDPSVIGIDPKSILGRFFAWADTATTLPNRALQTSDELFRTMAYDAELMAQAFRKTHDELARGVITAEQFNSSLASKISDGADDYMKLAALKNAEVQTFSQLPDNTKNWRAWKGMAEWPVIGRLAIPFRRTPFNIATFSFQRTPLAPLVKSWRDDIKAGGARADLAWSKFVVGNSMLLLFSDLAMNGHITGDGPANSAERASLQRTGWQPNSVRVRIGGTDANPTYRYFSFRGMEPVATSMHIAANTVDILRHSNWDDDDAELTELGIAASMSIMSQVTSQSYMSGASALFDALSDPRRYGENYWENIAKLPVPLAVSQVARAQDPTVRMTTTLIGAFKSQIPGLSATLPPQRDLWGREITRSSGLGDFYDSVSPIYSRTTENAQPIDQELNRIELYIPQPPLSINQGGAKVSLRNKPEIYSRFVQLQGNETKIGGRGLMDRLNDIVMGQDSQSEAYRGLSDGPDGSKAMLIEQWVRAYREVAKGELLAEYPELKAELDRRVEERVEALRPAP